MHLEVEQWIDRERRFAEVHVHVLAAKGLVVAAANGSEFSGVWCFDGTSLLMQWGAPGRYDPLIVGESVVLFREWNGGLVALRIVDGAGVWEAAWEASLGGALLWRGKARLKSGQLIDIETGVECGSIHLDGMTPIAQRNDVWLLRDGNRLCSAALPTMARNWTREVFREATERFSVAGGDEMRVGLARGTSGEILVLGYAGSLLGVAEKTGDLLWHYSGRVGHGVPEAYDGRLYGMSGSSFLCLDEKTGAEVYRVPVSRPPSFYLGAHFFGDFMLTGFESGHVLCFDKRDGRLAWMTEIKGGLWGFQAMDGNLFVTTHDARLLKFSGDPSEPPKEGIKKRGWRKPNDNYYWTNYSPRAQFEVDAYQKTATEQDTDFGKRNAKRARELVKKHCGRDLGEGLDCLSGIDECVIVDLKAESRGRAINLDPEPATVFLLGCLVGEVLIERFGGHWVMIGVGDVAVDIPLPSGNVMQVNVLGKVLKLFTNGMEDSVRLLVDAIQDQIEAARVAGTKKVEPRN